MNWYQCEGNFEGNSWFCACCGMQFIYGIDGYMFGWQLNDDPSSTVWASAEPPEDLALNFLDYMKFGNAIFNGNFNMEEFAAASTAEERLKCLVNLITRDNKLFLISVTDPRIKRHVKGIAAPVNPSPNRKFSVKEGLLTLPKDAEGRKALFLDFSALPIWGVDAKEKINKTEWHNIINVIWSTWEFAHAVAFIRIPETQQHKKNKDKTDCAKRLCQLANCAAIRSRGVWACGTPADESTKRWAETVWPFPVQKPIEGAKGLLALCDGTMA